MSNALIISAKHDLLEKVRKNPKKWNSRSLKFKIESGDDLSAPSVAVQLLRVFYEITLPGPWTPNASLGLTIQRIRCHENFELSFEFMMVGHNEGQILLTIGNWFGLNLKYPGENTIYTLQLKQANGLYDDYTDIIDCAIRAGMWQKELSIILSSHLTLNLVSLIILILSWRNSKGAHQNCNC